MKSVKCQFCIELPIELPIVLPIVLPIELPIVLPIVPFRAAACLALLAPVWMALLGRCFNPREATLK